MQMVPIIGDFLIHRRQADIDQQVVVTGVGILDVLGRHPHVAQPEPHLEWLTRRHRLAIVGPADVQVRIWRRRRRAALDSRGQQQARGEGSGGK
ncbi:hypothetical protein D3C72_2236240 [compost metagenome]